MRIIKLRKRLHKTSRNPNINAQNLPSLHREKQESA